MVKRFKTVAHTGTVEQVTDDAIQEVEELKGEIEEWQSSMEGANMEHLPKYDEVSGCLDQLETLLDALTDARADLEGALLAGEVSYTEQVPYGRRGPARWLRLSNALSSVRAAAETIENDDLENAASEGDGIEFPTMF